MRCCWHQFGLTELPRTIARPSCSLDFLPGEPNVGQHASSVLARQLDHVIAGGTPELVLVSRYSGIGKASVVNELHKLLVKLSIGE